MNDLLRTLEEGPAQDQGNSQDDGEPHRQVSPGRSRDDAGEDNGDNGGDRRGGDDRVGNQAAGVDREEESVLGRREEGRVGGVQKQERRHDGEGLALALSQIQGPANSLGRHRAAPLTTS